MNDVALVVMASVLIGSLVLPRRWLHLVGLWCMAVICWGAVGSGLGWPAVILSGMCCAVHIGMLYCIWVLRRNPG